MSLIGRHFRVRIPIGAIETLADGKDVAVTIPLETVFQVVSDENEDRMARVLIAGHQFMLFAIDIEERCYEVMARVAASRSA